MIYSHLLSFDWSITTLDDQYIMIILIFMHLKESFKSWRAPRIYFALTLRDFSRFSNFSLEVELFIFSMMSEFYLRRYFMLNIMKCFCLFTVLVYHFRYARRLSFSEVLPPRRHEHSWGVCRLVSASISFLLSIAQWCFTHRMRIFTNADWSPNNNCLLINFDNLMIFHLTIFTPWAPQLLFHTVIVAPAAIICRWCLGRQMSAWHFIGWQTRKSAALYNGNIYFRHWYLSISDWWAIDFAILQFIIHYLVYRHYFQKNFHPELLYFTVARLENNEATWAWIGHDYDQLFCFSHLLPCDVAIASIKIQETSIYEVTIKIMRVYLLSVITLFQISLIDFHDEMKYQFH